MPESLIKRADQILKIYENKEVTRDIKIQESLPLDELMCPTSEIEDEINKLNILEITPLDAMNVLYRLKEKINNK